MTPVTTLKTHISNPSVWRAAYGLNKELHIDFDLGCVRLFIAVIKYQNTLENNVKREEKFILAHGFRGFSSW
jgi:hypothetical protein